MSGPSRALLVVVSVCVALLAWTVRSIHDQRVDVASNEPARGWFSPDPDSQYHMRRVERALDEGLPPAEFDPRMNFPVGAAIPWPPYYTYVLHACVAPFAPSEPAARAEFIERRVATMPSFFASLVAVIIAWVAWELTRGRSVAIRAAAAAIGGVSYALCGASIEYSGVGNGDHHAWVSLLFASMLWVSARAFDERVLENTLAALRHGVVLGLIAGILIGSWVGGLVYVGLLELAFGLALFAHARRERRALAVLGLVFHLTWAVTIAPAVLSSPWKDEHPWILVNLSWLHLAHPIFGALVFAPLASRARDTRLRLIWPWIVAAVFATSCAAIAFGDFELARSVREGFAWAGRNNQFMAFIAESQPLGWGPIGGFAPTMRSLGYGALLLVPAWIWLAWRAWRESRLDFALFAILLPPLAAQALVQRRFADALAVPLAIALGVALASWAAVIWRERIWIAATIGAFTATALQFPTLRTIQLQIARPHGADSMSSNQRGVRALHAWIARHSDPERMDAVLATWDQGHTIEWVARRGSIATNFGSYLGEDSYLDPWRFFLADEPSDAERLLRERQARFVLITGDFSKDLEVMLRVLRPESRRSYLLIPREGPVYASQRFFTSMAARLMMNGRVGDLETRSLSGDSLDFLRLVHVSPQILNAELPIRHTNARVPIGWVWEHVPGAWIELVGRPGETYEVRIELEGGPNLPRFSWIGSGVIGADGTGRVRVPYCTEELNGDVRALGPARCSVGARTSDVRIDAQAVASGAVLTER